MLKQSWLPKWHSIKTSRHSLNTVLSHWDHITRALLPPPVQKAKSFLLPPLRHRQGPAQPGCRELGCALHCGYKSLSGSQQHGGKPTFGLVSGCGWFAGTGSVRMTQTFTAFCRGPAHTLTFSPEESPEGLWFCSSRNVVSPSDKPASPQPKMSLD